MSGLQGDDGFVGATVTRDEGLPNDFFDASAYSFFGTTGDDVGGLEGELELGLEGPPEEESCVVEDDDYYLGYHAEGASDEEDLSLASLYAVAGVSTQVLPKPAAEPAPPVPAPPPPRPSGSIALGGLLAAGGDRAFYTPSPPAAGARSLESRPGSGGPPLSTSLLGQGPLPPEPQPSTYYQDQGGAFQDPSVVAGAPGLLRHQQALAGYAAAPPPPVGMTASALEASLLARSAEPRPPPLGPPSGHPVHGYPGPPPPPHFPMPPPPPGHVDHRGHRHSMPPPPGFPAHMGPPPGFSGMAPPPLRGPAPPASHLTPPPVPPPGPPPGPWGGQGGQAGPPPPRPAWGATEAGPQQPRPPSPSQFPALGAGPRPGRPGAPAILARPAAAGAGPQGPGPQQPGIAQRLQGLTLADRSAQPQHGRGSGPGPRARPPRYQSLYMSSNEIDGILYTQWRGLQQGPPYVEDYYFQGFVYKYYNRKNRRFFAPESVRELAPTEKLSADQVAFVHLDGLGRVPFSNIRRPRPLMELGGGPGVAEEGAEAGPGAPARSRRRRLDQEPLLAARIMIEDCMSLILDVQDIDQIFVAAAGYPIQDEAALRSRRQLLLEGLSASLRLPDAPGAGRAAPDPGAPGDAVFRRLMGLRKGRTLAARALRVTFPPAEERQRPLPLARAAPNLRLLWAVLRGAGVLWSDPGGGVAEAADELAASARLADAAAEVLAALPAARMLADAAVALAAGLAEGTAASLQAPGALAAPVPAPETPWLGGVLGALCRRAGELRIGGGGGGGAPEVAPQLAAARIAWEPARAALAEAVLALEGGEAGALSAALEGLRA
ncbi:hypothetical protein ACKKBF_B11470 [Auxenochlorella protothecoides x Auxenochlorella symbiontica]